MRKTVQPMVNDVRCRTMLTCSRFDLSCQAATRRSRHLIPRPQVHESPLPVHGTARDGFNWHSDIVATRMSTHDTSYEEGRRLSPIDSIQPTQVRGSPGLLERKDSSTMAFCHSARLRLRWRQRTESTLTSNQSLSGTAFCYYILVDLQPLSQCPST